MNGAKGAVLHETDATARVYEDLLDRMGLEGEVVDALARAFFNRNLHFHPVPVGTFLGEVEREILRVSLLITHGSVTKAARMLGIKKSTMQTKLKRLGVTVTAGDLKRFAGEALEGLSEWWDG